MLPEFEQLTDPEVREMENAIRDALMAGRPCTLCASVLREATVAANIRFDDAAGTWNPQWVSNEK